MVRMDFRGRDGNRAKPVSTGGRLGLTLFLFFFAMGSLFEVLIVRELCRAAGQRAWAKVPCRILSSEVRERNHSESPFVFAVSYEYVYEGATHTNSIYKRNYSGSGRYSQEQQRVQEYPVGLSTFCYVNPAHPAEAVLQRQSLLIGLAVFFPLIFIVIGGGGILLVWRKPVPETEKPIARAAIASQARSRCGRHGLAALFAVFAAVGGGLLYPLGIRPIARTIDAESWVATPCRVLRAEVRSHRSDDGTTYSVYVLYQYEFNGQTYKSDRFGFVGGSSSGYQRKARIVKAYKRAARPICYVDPRNPSQAVLQRGFHAALLVVLLPLVFLLVGVGGFIGTLRGRRASGAQPVRGDVAVLGPIGQGGAPEAIGHTRSMQAGRAVLATKFSPRAKFAGILIIALFWNGIVSVFIFGGADGAGWFGRLFLLPFVAAGLGLIAAAVYQFLALFNPRPRLELSASVVPLGGAAELRWSFTGRTSRIRELVVTLRGVEEARYRRGTDTCTDRNTFYEMELIRTADGNEMAAGQVGFVMPQDTMHSFEAENNKVLWQLDIHGDIRRWPDVKESFKINVTPLPAQRMASV
jgi:hypothetical protein